jgi:hypothetical protein
MIKNCSGANRGQYGDVTAKILPVRASMILKREFGRLPSGEVARIGDN